MLLQHILTKDIFLRVFAEDQFHRENDIARRLDALEGTFFTGDTRRQAIDRLRGYYGVIGRSADEIADYAEKQSFLKAIYEDFYKAYNPCGGGQAGGGVYAERGGGLHHTGGGLPAAKAFRAGAWRTRMCRYWTLRRGRGRSSRT